MLLSLCMPLSMLLVRLETSQEFQMRVEDLPSLPGSFIKASGEGK